MIYKLSSSQSQEFLRQPESGMGYQLVRGILENTLYEQYFLVFNAEAIISAPKDQLVVESKNLFREGYESKVNRAETRVFKSFEVVSSSEMRSEFIAEADFTSKKVYNRHRGGTGAKDSYLRQADGKAYFIRLSHFRNDRRIDVVNKRLLSGSYTTTFQDYRDCVYFKDDPIDRYALPNNAEIHWAFYIQPATVDFYKQGIVQPAFGKIGGGIEALFEKGTSVGTYLGVTIYGEKVY